MEGKVGSHYELNDTIVLINFAFNRAIGLPLCSFLLEKKHQYNEGVLFLLFCDFIEDSPGISHVGMIRDPSLCGGMLMCISGF